MSKPAKPATVDCPDCKGNGYLEEPCTRCRNFGGRHCGTCSNTGWKPLGDCTRCKKTGRVSIDSLSDAELAEAGLADDDDTDGEP